MKFGERLALLKLGTLIFFCGMSLNANDAAGWEFNGYLVVDGVERVSLRNRVTGGSFWCSVGEESHGLEVVELDRELGRIEAVFNSANLSIPLKGDRVRAQLTGELFLRDEQKDIVFDAELVLLSERAEQLRSEAKRKRLRQAERRMVRLADKE